MRRVILLVLLLASAIAAQAAKRYVRPDGHDTANGANDTSDSSTGAWLTISHALGAVSPGDVIYVNGSLTPARISITVSGSSGNFITLVGQGNAMAGTGPVMRGFDLTGASYIRVINFEITHVNATYNHAFVPSGTCSNIEILDNYIHDLNGNGIRPSSPSTLSYWTVRGNFLYYLGNVPGYVSTIDVTGLGSQPQAAGGGTDHCLIEYNTIQRSGDFTTVFGEYIVQRNNHYHDFQNSYWADGSDNALHSDGFQPGSDGMQSDTRHHLYEANFCGDSTESNSHFGLWQDNPASGPPWNLYGDTDILIRGNIGFNYGSGGIGVVSTQYVNAYNNTFYKTCQKQVNAGDVAVILLRNFKSNPSDYGTVANNLVQNFGSVGGIALSIETPQTGGLKVTNWGYQAGTDATYVGTTDPLMVAPDSGDFHIQSGSPSGVKSGGTALITITSGSGSGTSFDVDRPDRLRDGYGLGGDMNGDTVTIGATTTYVTAISGSTITVADSVSWTQNTTKVYWGNSSTVQIGALPYGSSNLTTAVISNAGTTYTVTTTGSTRGVWFYVDGIPTTWTSTSPYQATIASGAVTAKAYALYAQAIPSMDATPLAAVTPARARRGANAAFLQ